MINELNIKFDRIPNLHDRQLCIDVVDIHCDDWDTIDENAAETDIGKAVLHYIKMYKYHQQEYRSRVL